MATFVAMQPPAGDAAGDKLPVVVRDGFAVLALIAAPLWLAWHRLWLEAALALAALLVFNAVGQQAGLQTMASLLSLLVSLWVALEGAQFRLARLRRLGFIDLGVVEARDRDEAELRASLAFAVEEPAESPWTAGPISSHASRATPGRFGPAFGLFAYPGKR